jgi:hypothetical protein
MQTLLRHVALFGVSLCLGSSTLWAQARPSTDNNRTSTAATPTDASAPASVALDASTSVDSVPARFKKPQIMNFDKVPKDPWVVNTCGGTGTGTTEHGILTINSPADGCYEYIMGAIGTIWDKYVDDENRGWVIEASLKVDPSTAPECDDRGAVQLWAGDAFKSMIIGISTDEICIAYPEMVHYAINTTDSFHIYRIESKGPKVRIYVDGQLRINHTLSTFSGSNNFLQFGDGTGGDNASLTQWDYYSYDVFP